MTAPATTAAATHAAEISIPRHSRWVWDWFGWYTRKYLIKHFHAVRLLQGTQPEADDERPMLVMLNHASWWDPLVGLFAAQTFLPGRKHFAAMDREALGGYSFFEKIGFFGVDRGSTRGALEFLHRVERIMASPPATLWVTPHGRYADARERPVQLLAGLAHAAARTPHVVVWPLAIEYVFWAHPRPEILLAWGDPVSLASTNARAWQAELPQALERVQDKLAAASMARQTERFTTLLQGESRMSGVYRWWQQWRRHKVVPTQNNNEHSATA